MPDHPTGGHCTEETGSARPEFTLVLDPDDQERRTTASRRLRRGEDLLAAAHHMITSGYHPKAGATALRLAQLFAARMRRSRDGHFVFAADATARALGLSRRTVMYAAKHLRELGLIAYVEHGTKANARRAKGTWKPGDGYRATATIFAAVAPPAYDEARARRLSGHGYHARITGVTSHGRHRAIAEARRKATQTDRTRCTPSVVVSTDHLQVQVDGGNNYTSRTRASRKTPTSHHHDHHRTTPQRCARNITATQQLQTEIWWLHRTCSRKLAYALRPLLDAGWTAQSLAAELRTWGVPGHLRNPIAYIHHELARRQNTGELPPTHAPPPQPAKTLAADETAERYTALLRSLDGANTPAWQHYETQLRPGTLRACANRRAVSGSRSPPRTAPLRWRRIGDALVVRARRVSRTPKRARGGWRPCATSRRPSAPSPFCVPNWRSAPADEVSWTEGRSHGLPHGLPHGWFHGFTESWTEGAKALLTPRLIDAGQPLWAGPSPARTSLPTR